MPKHIIHTGNICSIPGVEGLIEYTTPVKHIPHICNITNIPAIKGLVKRAASIKHVTKISRLSAYIPASQGLIEFTCSIE
jgi:hypothetical protein